MDRVFKRITIAGYPNGTDVRMEQFDNCREIVQVCKNRPRAKGFYKCHFEEGYKCDKDFEGISKMSEAYDMMNNGWCEKVDALKDSIRNVQQKMASDKISGLKSDVVGFVPIVPNALMGLPNSMLNTNIKPKKNKVINILYGLDFSCYVSTDDILKAGLKVMRHIMKLEAQGFRVRLTAFQCYNPRNNEFQHILTVKCKSEDQPLDAQRVMFPMFHPAMFRSIGFGWYETLPESTYIDGYGAPIHHYMSEKQIDDMMCQLFGRTAVYIDGSAVLDSGETYIQRRLKGVAL